MQIENLTQKLKKTFLSQTRRKVAEELAKIGSDEAIEALIAMVEGRKINLFSRYTLKDQIIGIDALVLTNKFKSLNYLKSLLQESISASSEEYLIHDAGYTETCTTSRYYYPNAKGELQNKLNHTHSYWGIAPNSLVRKTEVYYKIEQAILRLEKKLSL